MIPDNEILKAFLDAARDAMSTMAMLELEVERVTEAKAMEEPLDYTALMGLSGDDDGVLVITLSASLARKIVCAMLGMDESELEGEEDVLDGTGEVANMVAGGAKTALSGGPYHFDLSLPTTMSGDKIGLHPKSGTPGVIAHCHIGGEAIRIGVWKKGVAS